MPTIGPPVCPGDINSCIERALQLSSVTLRDRGIAIKKLLTENSRVLRGFPHDRTGHLEPDYQCCPGYENNSTRQDYRDLLSSQMILFSSRCPTRDRSRSSLEDKSLILSYVFQRRDRSRAQYLSENYCRPWRVPASIRRQLGGAQFVIELPVEEDEDITDGHILYPLWSTTMKQSGRVGYGLWSRATGQDLFLAEEPSRHQREPTRPGVA